ncbi:MAG: hypothetical protein ACE5Q7_02875, partial [Candidatus Nitrosomaritimum yanchengensis]
NSDFILFSPRKFLGVPDGGILNINSNVDFSPIQLENPPSKWWLNSLNASIIRREYDLYCDNRSWYKFFQEAEQNSPIG